MPIKKSLKQKIGKMEVAEQAKLEHNKEEQVKSESNTKDGKDEKDIKLYDVEQVKEWCDKAAKDAKLTNCVELTAYEKQRNLASGSIRKWLVKAKVLKTLIMPGKKDDDLFVYRPLLDHFIDVLRKIK